MKNAILQVADTGPLESLVLMLRSVGYECYLPNSQVKNELRRIGCDTVLDVEGLVRDWGYERPMSLPIAGIEMMEQADLFVDVKAVRSYGLIVDRWPHLKDKVLWYRINGGEPEHVIRNDGMDCGDESNPPCPVLTPNQWYKEEGPWSDRAYVCWPPFYHFDSYYSRQGRSADYDDPICLIHNIVGWGYGALVEEMRKLGVRCYGVASPDGLIRHETIPNRLSRTLAMVHLKSSDAPGYALYEALAAACPLIITRRLIWRSHMGELFDPGRNCLVFDQPTHNALSLQDVIECAREVAEALDCLRIEGTNRRIGMNGRDRLLDIMWNERTDAHGLQTFLDSVIG